MRLAKLSEFSRLIYTPSSAPSKRTLRSWICDGQLAGGHVDHNGHYYVDLDEYERKHRLREKLAARQAELARDPRLEGLL